MRGLLEKGAEQVTEETEKEELQYYEVEACCFEQSPSTPADSRVMDAGVWLMSRFGVEMHRRW